MKTITKLEAAGARFFSVKPDTYRSIVVLSGEGSGAIRIGNILYVSPKTVLAVFDREPKSVAIEKRIGERNEPESVDTAGQVSGGFRSEYARRTGLGTGKEKEKAEVLPAAGADPGQSPAIEGEIMPALSTAGDAGPDGNVLYEDQGPQEIVAPGANVEVGQTTHRHDETRINIDPNEGVKMSADLMSTNNFYNINASA